MSSFVYQDIKTGRTSPIYATSRTIFYSFDEDTMTLKGSTTGNEYRLGDEVPIRVKEVSVEKRQIDLVMLG